MGYPNQGRRKKDVYFDFAPIMAEGSSISLHLGKRAQSQYRVELQRADRLIGTEVNMIQRFQETLFGHNRRLATETSMPMERLIRWFLLRAGDDPVMIGGSDRKFSTRAGAKLIGAKHGDDQISVDEEDYHTTEKSSLNLQVFSGCPIQKWGLTPEMMSHNDDDRSLVLFHRYCDFICEECPDGFFDGWSLCAATAEEEIALSANGVVPALASLWDDNSESTVVPTLQLGRVISPPDIHWGDLSPVETSFVEELHISLPDNGKGPARVTLGSSPLAVSLRCNLPQGHALRERRVIRYLSDR